MQSNKRSNIKVIFKKSAIHIGKPILILIYTVNIV